MKYIILIFLVYAVNASQAYAETKFDISLKLSPTTWSGSNEDGRSNFSAVATQTTIGFGFQSNRLYGRLSFQGGTFSFTDPAPAQESLIGRNLKTNVEIEHGETDLILGYYFWRQISVFADIKSATNKWKNSNYEMSYLSWGVGVSGYLPLSQTWTFYGSYGFLLPYDIESNVAKIGSGKGQTLDLGFAFRWITQAQVSMGFKTQNQNYEFDNGNRQSHTRGEIYARIQYQF